jgi:hypothetical protein
MLSGQAAATAGLTAAGRQAGVSASAAGWYLADADLFPREITGLLIVARAELDRHVNDRGRCRACATPFPCQRACLAEQTLGWF